MRSQLSCQRLLLATAVRPRHFAHYAPNTFSSVIAFKREYRQILVQSLRTIAHDREVFLYYRSSYPSLAQIRGQTTNGVLRFSCHLIAVIPRPGGQGSSAWSGFRGAPGLSPVTRIFKTLWIFKNKITKTTYYILEYYRHLQVCRYGGMYLYWSPRSSSQLSGCVIHVFSALSLPP